MKKYLQNHNVLAITLICLLSGIICSSFKVDNHRSNERRDLLATRKVHFVRDTEVVQIGASTGFTVITFSAQISQ